MVGPDVSINGGQDLLHVFIDVRTGEYTEQWLDGQAIVEWDTSRNVYIEPETEYPTLRQKTLSVKRTSTSSPDKWAVLLSGGANKESNYARYWNDCRYAYLALTRKLDYPANHIFCLVSDGTNPAQDRKIGAYTYDSSPLDFDGDGVMDIAYSASKASLSTVFNYLAANVSPGDEVLLFVTDHGGHGGTINLWNEVVLTPAELDAELDKLGTSVNIDVVMGQCFSGFTTPHIKGTNRTIMTAVSKRPYSFGTDINGYDYFLKYWTDAIYNIDPDVSGPYSNGDGRLSTYEIFKYIEDNNPRVVSQNEDDREDPEISSIPDILSWGHDLEGNIFIPYITGEEHVSNYHDKYYYLHCFPDVLEPSWECTNDLRIISSDRNSARIAGNLPATQYTSIDATLSVVFHDLGEEWKVSTKPYVWRPGAYIGQGLITGGNGYYFLIHYPLVGIYPDTSGYMWTSDDQSCTITEQHEMTVRAFVNPAFNQGRLSVMFQDPFSDTIYVSDQIQ